MNIKQQRLPLLFWATVALIIAVRFSASLFMPWGQTVKYHLEGLNDEPAHYNYVKYIAQQRAFPVLEHFVLEPDAFTRNEFEYHQAPLYYLVCAPFYLLFGDTHAVLVCRLIAALAGILTVGVLALLIRDLGYSRKAQCATVLFAGFLPSHVYFSSFVSNDSLSWLFAALFTRELVRIMIAARSTCPLPVTLPAIRTAAYLTAGLLTKSSAALFFPIPGLVFCWLFWNTSGVRYLWCAVAVTGAVTLVAAPWYVRNFVLYHSFSGIPPSTVGIPVTIEVLISLGRATIKYLWFPMQHLKVETTAYFFLTIIGESILGLHAVVAAWWFTRRAMRRELSYEVLFAAALLCLFAVIHTWYFFAWLNPEARFLFPALGSICLFMIVPVHDLFCRIHAERFFLHYILLIGIFSYSFLFFAG